MKDEVYRVAERYGVAVTLVAASWMRTPPSAAITLEVVAEGFDAADDWIVAQVRAGDLVITGDIPLAARCVAADALVLAPTGRVFDEDNMGDILATRNLLTDLRSGGVETGGPASFGPRDRSQFLQAMDRMLQSARRR